MKVIFLFVTLLSFSAAANEVKFQLNETHALLKFVDTISGGHHAIVAIKETFQKSKYNNKKSKQMLKRYNALKPVLFSGFSFSEYPMSRRMGMSVDKFLLIQSSYVKSLAELEQRLHGLVPLKDQRELFVILDYFQEIYKNLLWKPHLKAMEKHLAALSEKVKEWGISNDFKTAQKFYRSSWPKNQDFLINLYPIPGKSGMSKAESLGPIESVSIYVETSDYAERMGVIFHELCHSLYKEQNAETQKWFESIFLKDPSDVHAGLAYQYINEALATAIGNGWMEKKIIGKVSEKPWYNNKYINGFAKALYPEVTKYMNGNKPIDGKLITKSIKIFKKTFPNAPWEFDSITANIVLAVDNATFKSTETGNLLRKFFRVWGMSRLRPINNSETVDYIKKSQDTLVLVLSPKQRNQLNALHKDFPFILKKQIPKDRSFFLSTVSATGRPVFLFQVEDNKQLELAMKKLKDKKLMPKGLYLESL